MAHEAVSLLVGGVELADFLEDLRRLGAAEVDEVLNACLREQSSEVALEESRQDGELLLH